MNRDPRARAAMLMIDWGRRDILLFPNAEEGDQIVSVGAELVESALRDHRMLSAENGSFTRKEAAIRDAFDGLLDWLERFENFIETNLVEPDDVRPYLKYWTSRIGTNGDPRLRQLRKYIVAYEFTGVESLLRRFGHWVDLTDG